MTTADLPAAYRPLDAESVSFFLAGLSEATDRLGGTAKDWRVDEVGDGNLNLVFLVEGPAGGVCVKQALPYVRLVGEDWPLSARRAYFEYVSMTEHARHAGRLVPQIYAYDPDLYAIVMERLSPHIIMRRGMVRGVRYPRFAEDISDYMARTLYFTSDLATPAAAKKALIATFCGNTELCRISEDLIFTDPYMVHARNRWTSPQLDSLAAAFREDAALKVAVSRLKARFLTEAQALLHGDLHTGSVMVTPDDTRVIDSEFAFYGPMGFDVGAVLGNLLLNYFAQDGHATPEDPREDYQAWVLETTEQVWTLFAAKFAALWREHQTGDAYPADLFRDAAAAEALEQERQAFLRRLFADALGFGAAKMIRRILGLAHNIDLEWIEDPDRRAACETRCLRFARQLMLGAARIETVGEVTALARRVRDADLAAPSP